MGWPQYTYLALTFIGLGLALGKNGEPKGNWSFFGSLFGEAILLWILWAGGFFA